MSAAIDTALASCFALLPRPDVADHTASIITDEQMQEAQLAKQLRATVAANEAARIDRVIGACAEALRLGKVQRVDILAADAAEVAERAEHFRRMGCDVSGPRAIRGDRTEWHAATAYLRRGDGSHEAALVVSISTRTAPL